MCQLNHCTSAGTKVEASAEEIEDFRDTVSQTVWALEIGMWAQEKGIEVLKYHIDSQTALLLDHYSEVVGTNDLSWSRA